LILSSETSSVGGLKDGKDITIDTVRNNSAVSRMSYSDKMHSSATRQICWIGPSGLVFEHTGLFFGRITETKLVDVWGREDNRGTWKMINDSHREATKDSDDESEEDHLQTQNHNDDDSIEGDTANPVLLDGDDNVTSGDSSSDNDGMMDCNDE